LQNFAVSFGSSGTSSKTQFQTEGGKFKPGFSSDQTSGNSLISFRRPETSHCTTAIAKPGGIGDSS